MIITCPECATEFKTPDSVFINGPRKLRCAQCEHVWKQDPQDVAEPSADNSGDDDWNQSLSEGDSSQGDAMDFSQPDPEGAEDQPDEAGPAQNVGDEMAALDEADDQSNDLSDAVDEVSAALEDDADGFADGDMDDDVEEDPEQPPLHDIESEAAENMETDNNKSRNLNIRQWGAAMAAVLVLVVAGYGGYAYREKLTRWLPSAAPVYAMLGAPVNLTGFEFNEVGVGRSFDNGFPVLSVKGKLVNISDRPRLIPDIRLALRSPDKQEVYHWTIKVKRAPLKPNETVQFSTRLASPPSDAEDIVIRFHKKSALKVGAL